MKAFFKKYQTIAETVFLLLILAGGCLWKYQEWKLQQMQQEIAQKVFRFHVRANSDSREDQALKLKVRDAVGTMMQQVLEGVDDVAECSRIVEANLAAVADTAQRTVYQEGYPYPVSAQVETARFPQKAYGNYIFPAGEYQALNVVIGSGKGRNWWCVMYPNLCFHDAVYEVVDDEAEKTLQRVLSEDEYDAVLKSGEYRIRFKYLDFLNRFLEE